MSEPIDSHHHLWRYDKSEYGWIGEDMSLLARDYLPENLRPELVESGIQGTVAVQTRQTLAETRFLLDFAEEFEFIRGVVGWAPIATAEFLEVLERLKGYTKLKGLRHVIQDELDDQFILRDDFNSGIGLLKRYSLVYDILIYEKHLPAAISFVDRHPSQIFVLDHIGKPRIRAGEIEPWRTNLQSLARRENVFCKLSGLVTEADWKHWQIADLRPYLDVVLGAFGARRLMVGSDWPVCLLASTPKKWFCTLKEFLRPLSVSEQDMILGGVASKVYSLG